MTEALIRVTQLPQIEERLRDFKEAVIQRTEEAKSLICTEETISAVKKYRSDLRKDFDELEAQRKQVKAAIFAPYERFEAVYKKCVADAFKAADAALKGKIDETEGEIKKRCEDGLREYFDELCAANGLDWLTFERSGVRVDMASAKQKTPKKLREQLKAFVERVAKDVDAISKGEAIGGENNIAEMLSEYKRSLDFSMAYATVWERHLRIEAEKDAIQDRESFKALEAEAVRKVEAVAPPMEVQPPMTVTFTVTDTRERLIALREWMKANGYQYK